MRQSRADRLLAITNTAVRRIDQKDFFGYQQIAGSGPIDYLNPTRQNAQINESYSIWLRNPLAKFIIDIILDHTWGDGLTFKANDKTVHEVLNDFYHDIDNDWEIKGEQRIQDLSIYGESLLKFFVSDHMGKVKVSSVFPGSISEVLRSKKNTEKVEAVQVTYKQGEPETYKILDWNEIEETYEGEAIYLKINSTVHQMRGLSDLFVRRDWLHLYDKSLYSTMDRVGLLLSFVWDITLKNAKEPEIKKKRNKIALDPPRPGSFRVHNENEEWKDISPNLQGGDFDEIYRLLRSQGMAGIPEHFWGLGGKVNVATAKEMSGPFYKMIRRRQRLIKNMFQVMFDYVIFQAKAKGVLKKDVDKTYSIALNEPNDQKAASLAETILKFSQSLLILETNGYIQEDVVDTVIKMLFEMIGVDVSTGETQENTDVNRDKKKDDDDNDDTEDKGDKKLVNFYRDFQNAIKGKRRKRRKK